MLYYGWHARDQAGHGAPRAREEHALRAWYARLGGTQMNSKPNSDSFGTFLDALQRSSPPPTPSGASLRVLRTLAGAGPRTVPELAAASGIGFTDLAATLTTLQEAGLVTMQGQPGREQVEITPHGSEIAALKS